MSVGVINRINDVFYPGEPPGEDPTEAETEAEERGLGNPAGCGRPDMDDLDRFIDGDIARRMDAPNMSWRRLDTCVKWRLLKEYLVRLGFQDDEGEEAFARVRTLLQNKELVAVSYDANDRAVTSINHPGCAEIDALTPVADDASVRPAGGPSFLAQI